MAIFSTSYSSVMCKNNTINEGGGGPIVFSSWLLRYTGYNTMSSGRCIFDGNESLKTINASPVGNHATSSDAKTRTHVDYKR